MPVVVVACMGFMAGLVAGLLYAPAPWVLAPACGALALLVWRRREWRGVVLAAAAAGAVWGGAARAVRASDCRLQWRDGEPLAVIVEPRDRASDDSPARRFTIVTPGACHGAVAVLLPHADTLSAVRVVVGAWRRDPEFENAPLPRRPERAGRIIARSARSLASAPGLRARLRLAAEAHLAALFGPARWPLAAALTLRPESALPAEVRERFARAGLAHILAISGFHIGVLAGAIVVVLRAARLPPARARALGALLVAGYIWLLGAPAPALRAALILALWCWARLRQRPPPVAALLATAATVIALLDPWTVFEAGAWLSFAGVWGCGTAARFWGRVVRESKSRVARARLRLLAPAAVSAGAVLATSPVQLIAFGTVSPIAVATNLVAVPLAAFAIPALSLALVLALLPGRLGALAAVPAAAAGVALDLLERVAAAGAAVPWGTLSPDAPVVAAAAALALAVWLLRRLPLARATRAVLVSRTLLAAGAMSAALCWAPVLRGIGLPGGGGADGDGRLALHFLAVGQGDAAAIRTPRGRWIVIDGGPRGVVDEGARKVVPFLRRQGARRVAVIVASHGDADHMGGLPAVLEALPADVALEPGEALGRPLYVDWLRDLAKDRARWHPARAGDRIELDDVTLRVWHPDSATIARGWPVNENSVVVTIEYRAFRALFGGDAGLQMEALRAGEIGRVTVLKVGHHGSPGASGPAWLAALAPRVCVIEVGRNTYGHPDAGVVRRLGEGGCAVYRTDRDGDVDVTTDGRSVRVRGEGRDTTFIVSKEQP